MLLPKQGNFFFLYNCGNGIAKNGTGKKNLWKSKKKKSVISIIFLQHFHNKSHVISYYQLKKICDKLIVAMVLPKQGKKKYCGKLIVAMPLPKQGGKKNLWQSNCGNGIAEIGRKKNCENLIVAMPLPKQGNKKKISNCGNGIAENGRKKNKIK